MTLVGRDRELRDIAGALADPELGGIVLSGPGGVGKTRLGEECLNLGEAAGYITARVTATSSAREIPLGALTPLLTDLSGDSGNLLLAARVSLSQRAGGSRWILFVDDAHLLDGASAALVQSLAADRTAFVVATVRSGEPAPDAVMALWKDGFAQRVDVAPLSDPELTRIAALMLDGPLDGPTSRKLCRFARGNALAMRELVAGAIEAGALTIDGSRWQLRDEIVISDRLNEVVTNRLDGLHPNELAGLELIAVGEPIDLELVTRLLDVAVAEALERQGLIQVRDDDAGPQVWLAHPLHGEILRDRLAVFRRRRILEELVAALDATTMDRTSQLRLARWNLELGTTDDAELLGAAARWSWLTRDLDSTALFSAAVWEKVRDPEIGTMLGASLTWLGRHAEAEAVLEVLLAMAPDDKTRAMASIFHAQLLAQIGDLDAALSTHDSRDLASPWREELDAHHARLLIVAGRIGEAISLGEPITRLGSDRPAIEAGFVTSLALSFAGRPLDAIAMAKSARALHAKLWERELLPTEPRSHEVNELVARAVAGEIDEAEARLTEMYTDDQRSGSSPTLALQATTIGTIMAARGRLEEAEAWFRHGAEHGARGPRIHQRISVAGIIAVAAQRRDLDLARTVARAESIFDGPAYGLGLVPRSIALGWLQVMDGDTATARTLLTAACAEAVRRGALAGAVDALHTLARAGILDEVPVDPATLRAQVQGELLDAKLDHVSGYLAHDPALLEDAATTFERIGAALFAAEAYFDASRAHRRSGDQRAATLASRRGTELAAQCPGAATPALRTTSEVVPLTNRERELALLAADGLSTKEIAERLVLSDRTVQNHLNRAYEKLGVSGRRELRSALRRPEQSSS